MSLVITETYGNSATGIGHFYLNRALRLFPTYWAVVLGCAVAYALGLLSSGILGLNASGPPTLRAAQILDQLTVLPQAVWRNVTLDTSLETNRLSIGLYYTVGLEMMFYALAPFVVLRRTGVIVALLAASVALHFLPFGLGLPSRQWQYEFFPSTLMFFVAGILAFRLYQTARHWRFPHWIGWTAVPVVVAYGAIVPYALYTNHWLPLALYALLALATPFLFIASRTSKLDRLCGDLSYPLYVVQGLAMGLLGASMTGPSGREWWGLALALALSAAIHLAIERPVERWRRRFRVAERQAAKPAPAAA
jgi:peptidoglycan/LPS O-acetylase OafA/YrhL